MLYIHVHGKRNFHRELVVQDGDLNIDAWDQEAWAQEMEKWDAMALDGLKKLTAFERQYREAAEFWDPKQYLEKTAIQGVDREEQYIEKMDRQVDRSKSMLQKKRRQIATRQLRMAAKTRVLGAEHGHGGLTVADRSKAILQRRRCRNAHQQRDARMMRLVTTLSTESNAIH